MSDRLIAGPRGPGPRGRGIATALFAIAATEVVAAVVVSVACGRGYQHALDDYVVTNALMGAAFAVCGGLVAWHRPHNPVGWLLLADGLGHATSAAAAPVADLGGRLGWPLGVERAVATVFTDAWPWSIGLFLPLVLQLFPDGRPLGRAGRVVLWATVATAPLFVLELALNPGPVLGGLVPYFTVPSYSTLAPIWAVSEVRYVLSVLAGLVVLVVRYRRGGETLRRQLLWLVAAVLLLVCFTTPWALVAGTPVLALFAIPLVPVSMTIAILRHQLLDIRLVVSRTVLYALLTACVVGAYVGLVALLDQVMGRKVGAGSSVLATALIAVGFNPVRVRAQRVVDRLIYGDRADPVRAISRVGARLVDADSGRGLPGVVDAVREALRLPFAALRSQDAEISSSGVSPELLYALPLIYDGARIGELVVGLRPGERAIAPPDRAVLELLTAPLAVAVHAVSLSKQLQSSREALVLAREEERRRLRRDLHDELGPVLTGVTFKADAVANLIGADPDAARRLVGELRAETAGAIVEIRRLVYDLRPPALDDLGLAGAIRQRAEQLGRGGPAISVDAADLPSLPAAVEAAAYRIAVEALANAVRHAAATRVKVLIRADDRLHVQVLDDGRGPERPWPVGVGMSSMRERAAELGGTCEAGPDCTRDPGSQGGGRVVAVLPLAAR